MRNTKRLQGAELAAGTKEEYKVKKEKKEKVRGFVLCVNGTDAGVVLFI